MFSSKQNRYMYNQLLSVLTLTQLTRIFEEKKGYDLRRMIAGSERLLDSLALAMDDDPSFMLSAVRVLAMPQQSRDLISGAISSSCSKVCWYALIFVQMNLIFFLFS